MVMLTKKKIEEVVGDLVGSDAMPVVGVLEKKDNISEFTIATKTKLDIKHTRKLLYKLYEQNLVSFTRKKDKKKGWYVYYWTFKPDRARFLYVRIREDRLERLNERLKHEESDQFFVCQNSCVRLNFDQATNFDFHCPECGEIVFQEDNAKKIADLKKGIEVLHKALRAKKIFQVVSLVVKKKKAVKKKPLKKSKKVVKKKSKTVSKKKKVVKKKSKKK